MEFGFMSLLPPLVAIAMAILTRQVLVSLFTGILVGSLLIGNFQPLTAFTHLVHTLFETVGDPEWNAPLIIFLLLLGAIVGLFARSGAAEAFARWARQRVQSRRGALFTTWLLGVVLFMDDYFNCLTVGTVMRPITDRYHISREKLAYIIDSTAAPICMLIPLSSWIAYVISLMEPQFAATGYAGGAFRTFLQVIPLNLYAWLAVLMVLMTSLTRMEFGPMLRAEQRAMNDHQLFDPTRGTPSGDDFGSMESSQGGTAWDLILPVLILVGSALLGFAYTGGYFDGGMGFFEAIGDTDAATSLAYASLLTLLGTLVLYVSRRVLSMHDAMEAVIQGFKSMVVAVTVLVLAWALGSLAGELGTASFITGLLDGQFPTWALPALIFIIAGLTAFSTGTSWGTMGITIPIIIPLMMNLAPDLMIVSIAAVLAGATFGDHCSPISDTTIMSSTGAACHHIDHVNTQLPYALTAGTVAAIGFLLAGWGLATPLVLLGSITLLAGLLWMINRRPSVA